MANPNLVILQLATAAASSGICSSQAVAAAGPLVLNGSLVTAGVATLEVSPYQRRVLAASSGADAGKTLTITGTNGQGFPISEVLTLANNPTTVYTASSFRTVTSVVASAAMAGSITVGTNSIGSTDWIVDDFTRQQWQIRIGVTLVSGSASFSVEHTYDDPNKVGTSLVVTPFGFSIEEASFVPPQVWSIAALTNKSATVEAASNDGPWFAHRLTITTGTGLVVMQSIQAGIRSY